MKRWSLLTILCLCVVAIRPSGMLLAQDSGGSADTASAAPAAGATTQDPTTGAFESVTEDDLQNFMNMPQVQGPKTECENSGSLDGTPLPTDKADPEFQLKLTNCIWERLEQNTDARDAVIAALTPTARGSGAAQFSGNSIQNLKRSSIDPAYTKLREHLNNRFQEAFYGDIQAGNKVKVVDHQTFYTLYKTRVSRGFIDVVAAFCLEEKNISDPSNRSAGQLRANIPEQLTASNPPTGNSRAEIRERNLNTFKAATGGQNFMDTHMNNCILNIKDFCKNKCGDPASVTTKCSETDFTRRQACQVQDAIEATRQNLIALDGIEEGFKALESTAVSRLNAAEAKVERYGDNLRDGEGKSINELSVISSGEFESTVGAEMQAQKDRFEQECVAGKQVTDPACAAFLNTQEQADSSRAAIQEFALRSKAMEEKLERDLKDPSLSDDDRKTNLETLLAEEGYSEDEIKAIVDNPDKRSEAVDDITASYAAKREALIKEMSLKVKAHTTDDGRTLSNSENDRGIRDQITAELADRPERMKQIIHFSNLIGSYIQLDGGSGGERDGAGFQAEQRSIASGAGLGDDSMENIQQPDGGFKESVEGRTQNTFEIGDDTIREKVIDRVQASPSSSSGGGSTP